jgi:pyruvate dehydrogenase E2 component (dihydrolipoamide acetyltransferase)
MTEEVRLPEISENVESGDVIEVLVKEGDFVEAEQSLIEIETEKAAFEVPSTVKGRIVEVNVNQGDKIKVGQVIVRVDTDAEGARSEPKPAEKEEEKKTQEARRSVAEQKRQPPQTEPSGKEKAQEAQGEVQEEQAAPKEEAKTPPEEPARSAAPAPAAPSVRQLARELGVDIGTVPGTGPSGRISVEDVKRYARSLISGVPSRKPAKQQRALPDFTKWGGIERKAISTTRRKIADTLSYTWSEVPQVTQFDQADVTALEKFRREYLDRVEQAGGKLTITSILLKVVASALKEFPKFNASFDPAAQEIIFKNYYRISVAVDTDRGLLVPVVRDVDKKSILQLSIELTELAEKTRRHKVSPEEMVGGNFTVSNLGGIGGTGFAPIIYWPQVAILGVARASRQALYVEGRLEPRLILPLSLSYDHRIIDGAEGLRFLRWIINVLENPFLLAVQEPAG